jgi:hypothetical protein
MNSPEDPNLEKPKRVHIKKPSRFFSDLTGDSKKATSYVCPTCGATFNEYVPGVPALTIKAEKDQSTSSKKMFSPRSGLTSPRVLSSPRLKKKKKEKLELKTLQEAVQQKWSRHASECSIGVDLPRLGPKHEITNGSGKVLFPTTECSLGKLEEIKELLRVLAEQLEIPDHDEILKQSFSAFEEDQLLKDMSRAVTDYITKLGEDHAMIKLLKASCSQGILSPFFVYLKINLLADYNFKDVPKSWTINVKFSNTKITVIHKKKQQGFETKDDDTEEIPTYSFEWNLKLIFDRELSSLKKVLFKICDFQTLPALDPQKTKKLTKLLRPWIEDNYEDSGTHDDDEDSKLELKLKLDTKSQEAKTPRDPSHRVKDSETPRDSKGKHSDSTPRDTRKVSELGSPRPNEAHRRVSFSEKNNSKALKFDYKSQKTPM